MKIKSIKEANASSVCFWLKHKKISFVFCWFGKYNQFFIKITKWIACKQTLNKTICGCTTIIEN